MDLDAEERLILSALISIETKPLNTMQRLHVSRFCLHKPVNLTLREPYHHHDALDI